MTQFSSSQTPSNESPSRTQVVVITGLSGAGKSTAIHALEDLGFYCCDNIPTELAPEIVELCERSGLHRICLGCDARLGNFLTAVDRVLDSLHSFGSRDLHILFIDANDETILRRFSETRRPHPMAPAAGNLLEGIHRERMQLAPLRARSTRILDTTRCTVHDLRRTLMAQFASRHPEQSNSMIIRIVSFGFKFGSPVDADLLFDVRFLANPFFVPEMKLRPGTDPDIAQFVLNTEEAQKFIHHVSELLTYTIPLYTREGKAYLTIGIGCTGGRHRSVAVANELVRRLTQPHIPNIHVTHRDVLRGAGLSNTEPDPK